MTVASLLSAKVLTKRCGPRIGCADVDLERDEGEVPAVAGEPGSGKSA